MSGVNRLRIAAHAKANLFLRVLGREESGFHSIETLFVLLELHDSVTIEKDDRGIELRVEGEDTGPAEQNLAYRAAEMMLESTGQTFGVRISLDKRIPVQAGLGGGSSNGAATLHAVNRLAEDAIAHDEIQKLADALGSDVPFFASRAACSIGRRRGEQLTEVPAPDAAPVLVAVPGFGVSTGAAYEWLSESRAGKPLREAAALDADRLATWEDIAKLSENDFESVLFEHEPRLEDIYRRLMGTEPLFARLCGSGSALIAVYDSEASRDFAASEIADSTLWLIRTKTRAEAAPEPEQVQHGT